MSKKPKGLSLPATSPLFIILCKDGKPHMECTPYPSHEIAQNVINTILESKGYTAFGCSPHRVQAYKPMV